MYYILTVIIYFVTK